MKNAKSFIMLIYFLLLCQVGPDSIVVQAGSAHKDKYEALPLNVTGHSVVAILNIKHLSETDAAYEYFLDVTTDVGNQK